MVVAVSKALEAGATSIICASTGNTSASAAAYGAAAGIEVAVVLPKGAIALGKLLQALIAGAKVVAIDGNFDDALRIVRSMTAESGSRATLVNSVNPHRIAGQKTAAFEICDDLGRAPDVLAIPVGNAGNITAYWAGFTDYAMAGIVETRPRMHGFQAAGAAPIVVGHPIERPETIATAIKIGNPATWAGAVAARDELRGSIDSVTDDEILAAYRSLAELEGVFCEPSSAATRRGRREGSRGRCDSRQRAGRRGPDRQWPEGSRDCRASRRGPDRRVGRNRCRRPKGARLVSGSGTPDRRGPGGPRAAPVDATSLVGRRVSVEAPATIANLGAGYDTLGLAVDLALQVTIEARAAAPGTPDVELTVDGEGAGELAADRSNRLIVALEAGLAELGVDGLDRLAWRVEMSNPIPLERGLGSSAAATVAGLVAASALVGGHGLDQATVLRLATQIEGHPDNVAPALLGGLTASIALEDRVEFDPARPAPRRRPARLDSRSAPEHSTHARASCRTPCRAPMPSRISPAWPSASPASRQAAATSSRSSPGIASTSHTAPPPTPRSRSSSPPPVTPAPSAPASPAPAPRSSRSSQRARQPLSRQSAQRSPRRPPT